MCDHIGDALPDALIGVRVVAVLARVAIVAGVRIQLDREIVVSSSARDDPHD